MIYTEEPFKNVSYLKKYQRQLRSAQIDALSWRRLPRRLAAERSILSQTEYSCCRTNERHWQVVFGRGYNSHYDKTKGSPNKHAP